MPKFENNFEGIKPENQLPVKKIERKNIFQRGRKFLEAGITVGAFALGAKGEQPAKNTPANIKEKTVEVASTGRNDNSDIDSMFSAQASGVGYSPERKVEEVAINAEGALPDKDAFVATDSVTALGRNKEEADANVAKKVAEINKKITKFDYRKK